MYVGGVWAFQLLAIRLFADGSIQTDEAYVSGDNQITDNKQSTEFYLINGNVKRNWEAIYELINNCNKVLNFVDGIKDPL